MGLLSAPVRQALQDGPIQIGTLIDLDFTFGVERYWSGTHSLTHNAETYNPVGDAGRISPLESSADLRANGLKLSLTIPHEDGAPATRFKNVTPEQYKNREAKVTLAFFDSSFQTVIHELPRVYSMDTLEYVVDPSRASTINLTIETELMRGGKRSIKRLTHEQQQDDHPGDLSLQFLAYLASGVEVSWGTGGAFFRDPPT